MKNQTSLSNEQNVLLKMEGINKWFPGVKALDDVSLTVKAGTVHALMGENGAGKSTLMKCLFGVYSKDSGNIFVDGKEVTDPDLSEEDLLAVRRKVGMVFQNPDNQMVATVVEDDVAFGPENLGIPSAEIRERVDRALRDVGMEAYARHEPHRLSGGQKRRVAIAGIMAMMPRCIIFDESTAMLDPMGRQEVMESILRLNREQGITVIMITHYMEEAAMADRILVLDNGDVLLEGTPEEVFEQEKTMLACGLGVPQCTELIHRLRACGISLDGKCITPEQCATLLTSYLEKEGGHGRD